MNVDEIYDLLLELELGTPGQPGPRPQARCHAAGRGGSWRSRRPLRLPQPM